MAVQRPKASPRKLPTQERASATVDAILVASARTFRERGFTKASVNVHAAIERHLKSLEDGTLVEELTALTLGYLRR